MIADPRIVRLAGEAEEAADQYDPVKGVEIRTDPRGFLVIETKVQGPVHAEADCTLHVRGFLNLPMLDELLRDLLAVRADLVKLNGGK